MVANVIASDGIYNSGSNPLYTVIILVYFIYICLGDTITKKDLELSSVSYNEIAYLGNSFLFQLLILSQYSKGERLEVRVMKEMFYWIKKKS